MGTTTLDEDLSALVGRGGERFKPARRPITLQAACDLADAVGDRNPTYRDADFAAGSVHGALVATPASIMAWWQNGFEPVAQSDWLDEHGVRHFRLDPLPARKATIFDVDDPYNEVMGELGAAGFSSFAGVGGELLLHRYPRVGDLLSFSGQRLASISERKKTALGTGYFTTRSVRVRDAAQEPVAEIHLSSIVFAPLANGPAAAMPAEHLPPPLQPAPAIPRPDRVTLRAADVHAGQQLPSLVVECTHSLVIAGAIFSHDPMDVHHDPLWARHRGFQDIFMNTMTTQALVCRFVNDWAGPEARIERLAWRLGRQQFPGDTLYITGQVSAAGTSVSVDVRCKNKMGLHAACTVDLRLV